LGRDRGNGAVISGNLAAKKSAFRRFVAGWRGIARMVADCSQRANAAPVCVQKYLSRDGRAYHSAPMVFYMTAKRRMRSMWNSPVSGAGVALLVMAAQAMAQADAQEPVALDVVGPPARELAKPESEAVLTGAGEAASFVQEAVSEAPEAELAGIAVSMRPPPLRTQIPRTRWRHMKGNALWTRRALSALKDHGKPLVDTVPRDIAQWCPAYPTNTDAQRRAFWVGYMSALAKYESTYKPWAVGGGGRWYGLLQILPATARGYGCAAGTGEALKDGGANLSCGVRIMAHTVLRDGVIHGRDSRWRGVSADWGPMRNEAKRREMASWLKRQKYCQLTSSIRPRLRP